MFISPSSILATKRGHDLCSCPPQVSSLLDVVMDEVGDMGTEVKKAATRDYSKACYSADPDKTKAAK